MQYKKRVQKNRKS